MFSTFQNAWICQHQDSGRSYSHVTGIPRVNSKTHWTSKVCIIFRKDEAGRIDGKAQNHLRSALEETSVDMIIAYVQNSLWIMKDAVST